MPGHDASIRKALPQQSDIKDHAEHCSVEPELLAAIGRDVGEQMRVEHDEDERALYTVIESISDAGDVVRMGANGRRRLGTNEVFPGVIDSQVPHPDLSEAGAEEHDESSSFSATTACTPTAARRRLGRRGGR